MPLKVKQPVAFNQDMEFGAQQVPAGSRGFVTQLTTADGPVWVSVMSIRREVLVPQSVLSPLEAPQAARLTRGAMGTNSSVCRFANGKSVTLAVDRQYGNDQVVAGSKGRIKQVIPLAVSCIYWVRWAVVARDVLVPESDLV